ncbi:MAG: flagellar biosynthetic protein FliO [Deltaproteobacteria bacterium]|nr:flagellar biosynthetic protein FliO [Deltaproteobacteria bacterium]
MTRARGALLRGAAGASPLRVLARAPLSGSASLHLVEVELGGGVERVLIGVGSAGPVLLTPPRPAARGSFDGPLAVAEAELMDEPALDVEAEAEGEPPDPWPEYTRARSRAREVESLDPPASRPASVNRFRDAERLSRGESAMKPVRSAVEAKALVEQALAARGDTSRSA